MQRPGVDHGADPLVGHAHEAQERLERADEGRGVRVAGLAYGPDREPQLDAVRGEQVADRVEANPMELEEILERMVSGGGRQGRDGPVAFGGRGQLEPLGKLGQFSRELLLRRVEPHGQPEGATLETGADHQPAGVLDAVDRGLLLEVEEVDVHAVEAERQGQLDELAGAAGEGKAEGAEVAKHAGFLGWAEPRSIATASRPIKAPRREPGG